MKRQGKSRQHVHQQALQCLGSSDVSCGGPVDIYIFR
jgi:hypothetical protein